MRKNNENQRSEKTKTNKQYITTKTTYVHMYLHCRQSKIQL